MATPQSIGQRLADVGIGISALFKELNRTDERQLSLDSGSTTTLEHEAERFELWATNLGLHHSGHSSLDYRLRDVDFLHFAFKALLVDLKISLLQNSVLRFHSVGKNAFGNDSTAVTTRESVGTVVTKREQEELNDDYGSDSDQDQEDIYALLLRDVSDIIDRLYKISTKIRTSSSRLRSSKALHYCEVDEDTEVDLFEEFKKFDVHHLRELFRYYQGSPSVETESFLQARLSAANTGRRQQFRYWRRHHQKMTQVSSREKQDSGAVRMSAMSSLKQHISTLEQRNPINVAHIFVAPSMTTATHFTATRVRLDDQSSVISSSTHAGSETGMDEVQDFPEPPKSFYGLKYFQCPYCYTLCSSGYLEKRAWSSHLIHDLRPYICTYEHCELAHITYDRRQDWTEHESSTHRKSWRCLKHTDHTFGNILAYERHLHGYHADEASTQLEALLKAGETISSSPERPCPFCFATFESNDKMERHVAKHLERVAFFALPRSTGLEEDKDDISNSGDQIKGTRVSYSSLSAFSNETNADVESHESSHLSTRSQPVSSAALQQYPEAGESAFPSRVHEFVTNLQQVPAPSEEGEGVMTAYSSLADIPFSHGLDLSLAPSWCQEDLIGRQDDLDKLTRLFRSLRKPQLRRQVFAIVGIGGTGKSTLAYTFAQLRREWYSSIIWLNAGSEKFLRGDMLKMVQSITQRGLHDIVDSSGQEEEDLAVRELLKWLSIPGNDSWLLIFDGYDYRYGQYEPDGFDLQRYFPERDHGSILITTRRSGLEFAVNMRLKDIEGPKGSPEHPGAADTPDLRKIKTEESVSLGRSETYDVEESDILVWSKYNEGAELSRRDRTEDYIRTKLEVILEKDEIGSGPSES